MRVWTYMVGAVLCCAILATVFSPCIAQRISLEYAPSPSDNPLKGLVPYAGKSVYDFPHSMEFNYLPVSAVVKGDAKYDWSPMERLLEDISGRGCQAVVRFYLEYPGKKEGIPQYLIDAGMKVHVYQNTNTAPFPPSESCTPDYEDPRLRSMLKAFITEFGGRYDGDPRIGFVQLGLLGTWGEWHTYPRNELWASKTVQAEVMDAYEAAFKKTHLVHRYPAGPSHYAQADNSQRRMGYHDDSFAWATLETGRKEDDWFFVPALKAAGVWGKWRGHPVGGEIRPEAWGKVFDAEPGNPSIQDFGLSVEQTHASWMLDTGMFREAPSDFRRFRAARNVRRMGYEFYVPKAEFELKGRSLSIQCNVINLGVAPFYYDWPVLFALRDASGSLIRTARGANHLTAILPETKDGVWRERFDLSGVVNGKLTVLVKVENPLKQGKPFKFANATMDKDLPGWITLGEVTLK